MSFASSICAFNGSKYVIACTRARDMGAITAMAFANACGSIFVLAPRKGANITRITVSDSLPPLANMEYSSGAFLTFGAGERMLRISASACVSASSLRSSDTVDLPISVRSRLPTAFLNRWNAVICLPSPAGTMIAASFWRNSTLLNTSATNSSSD